MPGSPTREGNRLFSDVKLLRQICLRWEGRRLKPDADRIAPLVKAIEAEKVAALALELRLQRKLRRVPLLLVREMARHKSHRPLVADTLAAVIQRPDELCEFVALYWKDGRTPLSAQVKKGLAAAFPKFTEAQLAKYDRRGRIRLRDVLFLVHAKPRDTAQAAVWKKLIWGRLANRHGNGN